MKRDWVAEIDSIGVVGGGLMGSGIAEVAARAGLKTLVREPGEYLDMARARVERSLSSAVERGKATEEERDAALSRITFTDSIDDLAECPVVVEAVPEKLELKQEIFAELDRVCAPATILASTTSSIPTAALAEALRTSDETVAAGRAVAERLGKEVILTKDRAGFIVNMLLIPYLVAAVRMYEEGFASRDDIDTGMRLGCAHPMGPLQLADFIGLDVAYEVCNSLYEEFKDPAYAPPPLLKRT